MSYKEKTPRQILLEDLRHHQTLIFLATVTALGFSGWYWTSLPTHGYTKFDAPAIFAALLGMSFVTVYEFTKLKTAKSKDSKKSFMIFVAFSILTGVGTHMHSEQGATEEKMQNSSIFNKSLQGIESANNIAMQYGYAKDFNVKSLEAEKQVLLNSKAKNAKGEEINMTVATVLSKGWKSYSSYKDQLAEIDKKIQAKNSYDGAINARSENTVGAKSLDATETSEASWLIQIIGQILGLFGITEKTNAWSSFVLYLFATVVLEISVRVNGAKIRQMHKKLYGYDPDDIDALVLDDAPQQRAPAELPSPAPQPAPAEVPAPEPEAEAETPAPMQTFTPTLPYMNITEIGKHCYKTISSMVNSGALPLTQSHIKSAAKVELSRLSKTHQLESSNHEKCGNWIYNELKKERDEMQAAQQAAQPHPAPDLHISPAVATSTTAPVAASVQDPEQPRRPVGFVNTDNRAKAELPRATLADGTGIHSPVLGKSEEIYTMQLPEPPRVTDRVDAVHTPPADTVLNRVDTVQHGACNRVDTVQHGQADTVANTVNTPDIAPQQTDPDTQQQAIAIIWKGIDNGAIQRISIRDNGQCQIALKGHSIGKSNPQRRDILAVVFDALGKEGVLIRNPEYTDSNSGKAEWLINPARSVKYAA